MEGNGMMKEWNGMEWTGQWKWNKQVNRVVFIIDLHVKNLKTICHQIVT